MKIGATEQSELTDCMNDFSYTIRTKKKLCKKVLKMSCAVKQAKKRAAQYKTSSLISNKDITKKDKRINTMMFTKLGQLP